MKNIVYYTLLMLTIVILLPLIIVRGCSRTVDTPQSPGRQKDSVKIKVYISQEKKVQEMDLDEYLKGVVAAEMPAEFELEALKAQAVAARTYAYRKKVYLPKDAAHYGADICTDSTHCQAWVSKENAMKKWDAASAPKYWNKIERAVEETHDLIITYNNNIANPVFHSNSGGKTENAEDVWEGNGEPYLRSVFSQEEDNSGEFKNEVTLKVKDFYDTMKKEYPGIKLNTKDILKDIQVLEYSEGERVKTLKVGNIILKGTDFRRIFSLKSTNLEIEAAGKDSLKIITYGNGHGVGMSQWGANYMAKNGNKFDEILKYYYNGITLDTIDAFEAGKNK